MPTRASIRALGLSSRVAVARARDLLREDTGSVTLGRLSRSAPALMDSALRPRMESLLADAGEGVLRRSAELSLAMGRRLVLHDRPDEALPWLLRARERGDDARVSARATWEIGCIYLERGEISSAELVSRRASRPYSDGVPQPADLEHLDALVAETQGQLALAEKRYRYAIDHARDALSPYTRVAALRNLASAISQRDPAEAASLCGLALAVVEADELDPRLRPALLNVLSYALLGTGRVEEGRECAAQALAEAERLRATRVCLYARFNLAIAHELEGQVPVAVRLLEKIRDDVAPGDELRTWCRIRLAWLTGRQGDPAAAMGLLNAMPDVARPPYADSIEALRGTIACLLGHAHEAIGRLRKARATYDRRGDLLTVFALELWLAAAYEHAGRSDVSARLAHNALSVGAQQGFGLSPNYWHPILADMARRQAPHALQGYAAGLRAQAEPTRLPARASSVVVRADGVVTIDGESLDPMCWRAGRTGSRVLRRLFALLAASYPVAVHRDELMDLIWPESDGDRATANLYSAMNDLRHLLTEIPGVSVELVDAAYRLRADANVAFGRTMATAR